MSRNLFLISLSDGRSVAGWQRADEIEVTEGWQARKTKADTASDGRFGHYRPQSGCSSRATAFVCYCPDPTFSEGTACVNAK